MKIVIKVKDIKLNQDMIAWIEKKLNSLEKFAGIFQGKDYVFKGGKPKVEMWLEIGRETTHHRKGQIYQAEAQLRFPGKSIRSSASSENLRAAVTIIKDELQEQFKKYKDKRAAQIKRGARKFKRSVNVADSAKLKKEKGGRVRNEGI